MGTKNVGLFVVLGRTYTPALFGRKKEEGPMMGTNRVDFATSCNFWVLVV